jgi:hypothetical protein
VYTSSADDDSGLDLSHARSNGMMYFVGTQYFAMQHCSLFHPSAQGKSTEVHRISRASEVYHHPEARVQRPSSPNICIQVTPLLGRHAESFLPRRVGPPLRCRRLSANNGLGRKIRIARIGRDCRSDKGNSYFEDTSGQVARVGCSILIAQH